MSDPAEAFPPGWRRAAGASALRSGALSVAIIGASLLTTQQGVLTSVLPLIAVLYVLIWLGLFSLYLKFQVRRIRRAEYPVVLGAETLFVGIVLFVTVFAKAYYLVAMNNDASFSESMTHFDCYYYAVTVLSTVGFGDITPVTIPARALTMAQMVLDLGILAIVVRLITGEVKRAHERKRTAPADDD